PVRIRTTSANARSRAMRPHFDWTATTTRPGELASRDPESYRKRERQGVASGAALGGRAEGEPRVPSPLEELRSGERVTQPAAQGRTRRQDLQPRRHAGKL